jgi:hypothetical protein
MRRCLRRSLLLAVLIVAGGILLGPALADDPGPAKPPEGADTGGKLKTAPDNRPEELVGRSGREEVVKGIDAGEAVKNDNLKVFPLYEKLNEKPLEVLSMTEAVMKRKFKIYDSGGVNNVRIVNMTGKPVLILGGEMVFGGRQDRIFATDTIIPPTTGKATSGKNGSGGTSVQVFCVEAGRWGSGSSPGARCGSFSLGKKRTVLKSSENNGGSSMASYDNLTNRDLSVIAAAASCGNGNSNGQGDVWSHVSKVNGKLGTSNSTSTYRGNLMKSKVRKKADKLMKPMTKAFLRDAEILGYACAINGEVLYVDLFCDSRLAAQYRYRLLKSYALEAMVRGKEDTGKEATLEDVRSLVAGMKWKEKKAQSNPAGVERNSSIADGILKSEIRLGDNVVRCSYSKFEK